MVPEIECLSGKFHPNDFANDVIPGWEKRPHVDIWGDYVLKLLARARDKKRPKRLHLIVNGPPRHGKTHFFSWGLPCWYLEHYPQNQIILGTHTVTLSGKYSYRVRQTIEANPDYFKTKVDKTSRDKKQWFTTEGGGMRAAGVGTGIQGEPAHLFIFDDLYKDPKQAYSQVYNEGLVDWFSYVARSRLEPGGVMLWSTTRWTAYDIVAHLKKKARSDPDADQYILINFPAIATKDESFRKKGDALWPDRYSRRELRTIKKTISPQAWHALYQGKPKSSYGKMIKEEYFNYFSEIVKSDRLAMFRLMRKDGTRFSVAADTCKWFQFCDTAMLPDDKADYTAVVTIGITPENDVLIYDVERAHVSSDEVWHYLFQRWQKHYPRVKRVFIEHKQSGITAFQTGQKVGLPLFKLHTEGSKEIRAMPMQELYQAGNVWHLMGAPWLKDVEDELTTFPGGDHDDVFDCVAYACGAMQSDSMWTDKSKFPFYGIRYEVGGNTFDMNRAITQERREKKPFGITSGHGGRPSVDRFLKPRG